MSKITVFLAYLKLRSKVLLFFLSCALIFAVVFFLYNLPLEPLYYGMLLCSTLGVLVFGIDLFKFSRRHNQLSKLQHSIALDLGALPTYSSLLEHDYQKLLAILFQDKEDLVSKADQSRVDLMEYYTLWAHQIKTPIAAMHLLLQSKENEDFKTLSGELFKIEQYVGMALQYLRTENPSGDFVLQRYSLEKIVRQAIHRYAKLFIWQKIGLDFQTLNCEILTDQKWLVFVVEQILSNALKYTKDGSISIYMEDVSPKILVIEDTGSGIATEDLPRVFELGFTGYRGRREKNSTGIGLYLCKKVLDKLGHTITIESVVGQGTKVKLDLDTVELFDPYSNVS